MADRPQESRSFKGTVELRDGANGPMIVGYGAVYNRDSSDLGFIEQVDPGAFDKTLREADVRGLGNHDPNWLLGRTKSGTMRLRSDRDGLYYEIDVNTQDPDGQRALAKVQRGDWDGASFSFQTIRDEWNWDTSPPQRRLLEVSLIDVGPVTFAAYPDATAASRALQPIAEKSGHTVQELVSAMKSGEIRSLMTKGTVMEDTETVVAEPATPDEIGQNAATPEVEERAGKMISAQNLDTMEEVHSGLMAAAQGLRDLIDVAKKEAPEESEIGAEGDEPDSEESERSVDLIAAEMEMRRRRYEYEAAA